jgi:hypothetical protein
VTVLKIIVLSDSHGDVANMVSVIEREIPDLVLHLGDHYADAEELTWAYPELTIYKVPGNCDWHCHAANEQKVTIEGVSMLLCHGHEYGVKYGLSDLAWHAHEAGVTYALFGHTHQAHSEKRNGVWLCNPGSCSSMSAHPTYGVLDVEDGTARFSIRSVYEEE